MVSGCCSNERDGMAYLACFSAFVMPPYLHPWHLTSWSASVLWVREALGKRVPRRKRAALTWAPPRFLLVWRAGGVAVVVEPAGMAGN